MSNWYPSFPPQLVNLMRSQSKVSEITLSLELSNILILCGYNFLVLLAFLAVVVEHGPRLFSTHSWPWRKLWLTLAEIPGSFSTNCSSRGL